MEKITESDGKNWFYISLGYCCDDEDKPYSYPYFAYSFFNKYKRFMLNSNIVKPYKTKYGRWYKGDKKELLLDREYSISYHKGGEYIHLTHGIDNDNGMADDIKQGSTFIYFGWKHFSFKAHRYLNLDKSLYKSMAENYKHIKYENYDEYNDINHQKIKFKLRDFDDKEIIATCNVQQRVWTKGDYGFKWLKYFNKDLVSTTLNIEYDNEVGHKKGSWKGGVTGESIKINKNESLESAIKRKCEERQMIYISKISEIMV